MTYNEDISKIDSLKNNLTLVFDTDILLSLGGFHGEIFKRYIEDLILLVNEVNSRTGKKYIKLRYFNYTWGEVEDVFSAAKFYVKGSNDYIREAAKSIASGCTSTEDIIVKKSSFETMLKSKRILKLDFDDAYDDKYISYNLEGDDALSELLSSDYTKEDIDKASKRASDIHKLRNGRIRKNFEDTGYILITDNRNIGYIASVISKNNSSYFYVMDCGKITNVLWQKMNKGLSTSIIPASMNIITKSQVVLSSYTTRKMHYEISSLEQKLKCGDITHETMVAAIYHFKEIASRPEEITSETIERNLSYIEQEVEDYGEELSYYKNALIEKDEDNLINEERHKNYVNKVNTREKLREKVKKLEDYVNKTDDNKNKIDKKCHRCKIALIGSEVLLFFMVLALYCYLVKVRKVEWLLFASTNNFIFFITGCVISIIAPGLGANSNKKILKRIRLHYENKYNFSLEDYEASMEKIETIKEQLLKLDSEIKAG